MCLEVRLDHFGSEGKEVQAWRRVPFVTGHYRVDYTFGEALLSLFGWHNETLNIWTHLFGFFLIFVLYIRSLDEWLYNAGPMDHFLFSSAVIASMFQMLASTAHHWFGCMSRTVHQVTGRLDYSAIALVLPSVTIYATYNIEQCHPMLLYSVIVAAVVGTVIVLFLCFWPPFQRPAFQPYRALTFSVLGALVVVPWVDAMLREPELRVGGEYGTALWFQLVGGAHIVTGVLVYVSRQPERSYPGKFDCLQSHCIWHVFVAIASYYSLLSLGELYHWRIVQPPCPA